MTRTCHFGPRTQNSTQTHNQPADNGFTRYPQINWPVLWSVSHTFATMTRHYISSKDHETAVTVKKVNYALLGWLNGCLLNLSAKSYCQISMHQLERLQIDHFLSLSLIKVFTIKVVLLTQYFENTLVLSFIYDSASCSCGQQARIYPINPLGAGSRS